MKPYFVDLHFKLTFMNRSFVSLETTNLPSFYCSEMSQFGYF